MNCKDNPRRSKNDDIFKLLMEKGEEIDLLDSRIQRMQKKPKRIEEIFFGNGANSNALIYIRFFNKIISNQL